MDYEAFDRGVVQYLVSCVHNGTRFYLTDDGLASDMQDRAARYRDIGRAHDAVTKQWTEWRGGFHWIPVRRIMGGAIL